MKTQYVIFEKDLKRRRAFVNYIMKHYEIKRNHGQDKEYMINSKFPFLLDLKEKVFFALESITCCARLSQKKQIISIKEFLKSVKKA